MGRVESADLIRYNANVRGKSVGDCVKRAISLAFDKEYNEVSKLLIQSMKDKRAPAWNYRYVYEPVILNLGADKFITVPNDYAWTLDKFSDYHPDGTWLVLTGPKADGYHNHIVCVIDGKVYDSWDSRQQYAKGYWRVLDSATSHEFSDIKHHIEELFVEAKEEIENYCELYINKYNLDVKYLDVGGYFESYRFNVLVEIEVNGELSGTHRYVFKIAFVFTPTTTVEKAEQKVSEICKVRMYDRFYEINKKISEAEEGKRLLIESGYDEDKYNPASAFWTPDREKRFINSLPGWVKPFLTYVSIEKPGQYSDSYQIQFKPLPGDPNSDKVNLYGYDSDTIKAELKMYEEEGFQRPGIDYNVSELF